MALANIREIEEKNLIEASARKGKRLLQMLGNVRSRKYELSARGMGLMAGLELKRRSRPATNESLRIIKSLLRRGFIFLPEGEYSNVISFTPPLTIRPADLERSVAALEEELQ